MNEFISTAHPARAGMLIKSLPMLLNLLPSFLLMSEILKKWMQQQKQALSKRTLEEKKNHLQLFHYFTFTEK